MGGQDDAARGADVEISNLDGQRLCGARGRTREVQIDLVEPAAEAGREGLGEAVRGRKVAVHGVVGLLLIESPRQSGAGSQRAGPADDDENSWDGAPELVT